MEWPPFHDKPRSGCGASLIGRIGETPYKIVFSLSVVGSIALMVVGGGDICRFADAVKPAVGRKSANSDSSKSR